MRRYSSSVSLLAFLLPSLVFAAGRDCDIPKEGWRMDTRGKREKAIYESYHDVWDDEDKPHNKIYFVIPSENGLDSEVFSIAIPSGAALELNAETMKRLNSAKEVRLYNPTSHNSFYFVPFAKDRLKNLDPKQHCSDARDHARSAGAGCTKIAFNPEAEQVARGLKTAPKSGKHERITLFYAEAADKCDKIADVQRNAKARGGKMTAKESDLLAEAVSDLNDYFDIEKGPNRRPSNLAEPVYADDKVDTQRKDAKKLKQVPPGGNRRKNALPAKETRGAH